MAIGIVVAGLVGIALAYWLLITTEGTYLGPHVVTLLYDWYARRYDGVKERRVLYESIFIALPLIEATRRVGCPCILDVAGGTGRVALSLLREEGFAGMVVTSDRSRRMLAEGRAMLKGVCNPPVRCNAPVQGEHILQLDASALAFTGETFDAVTCLEALEFMWSPQAVLCELRRVLRPGGVLLVTNRVGVDARFFPGRWCGRGRLERALQKMGFEQVRTQRWQTHYDLIWAVKTAEDRRSSGVPD